MNPWINADRTKPAAAALAAAGLVGYLAFVSPRLRCLGATAEEAARLLPGDELIPDAYGTSTMATTIDAPPKAVWPWLVQMGCDRAGWYSYDRLDNGGRPSADRLVPEWQTLAVGDRLAADPRGRWWFTVARLHPERTLVLRGAMDLLGHAFDPSRHQPRWFSDGIWAFHLEPRGGGTRLLVRTRGTGRPRALLKVVGALFGDPAHAVMQSKQFDELRRRAEAAKGRPWRPASRRRVGRVDRARARSARARHGSAGGASA